MCVMPRYLELQQLLDPNTTPLFDKRRQEMAASAHASPNAGVEEWPMG